MLKRLVQRRRHGKGPYGHLFAAPPGDEVMALDCETTGLNTRTAELVSVAAVPVSAGRVQAGAALDLRMARPASLNGESICIHGLRGVDLHDGVPVEEGLRHLLDFIGNRPLVGWCLDFDLGIINRYLRASLGFDLPNPVIELSDLYLPAFRACRRRAGGAGDRSAQRPRRRHHRRLDVLEAEERIINGE